jgi:hypothetical protein
VKHACNGEARDYNYFRWRQVALQAGALSMASQCATVTSQQTSFNTILCLFLKLSNHPAFYPLVLEVPVPLFQTL